ncbi:MAG: hypothetical protein OXP28_11930 [Gammaproteobacteria bacterium]|nr:hypothetical protein [Gammaproteobacteria bacterium]
MVSNFERIFEEITDQANKVPENFDTDALVTLAMEIVDQEDRHATKQANIKQIVENLIEQAATSRQSR